MRDQRGRQAERQTVIAHVVAHSLQIVLPADREAHGPLPRAVCIAFLNLESHQIVGLK